MLMKRNYLLPHVYQHIGLCAMLLSVGLLIAYIVVCMYIAFRNQNADEILSPSSSFTHGTYCVVHLLACIGILLYTFSREKYEDEMIDSVRKSAVVTAAYVLFLVYISITMLRIFVNTDFIDLSGNKVSLTKDLMDSVSDPMLFFLVYEIVFRTRLIKLRKALRDEE